MTGRCKRDCKALDAEGMCLACGLQRIQATEAAITELRAHGLYLVGNVRDLGEGRRFEATVVDGAFVVSTRVLVRKGGHLELES
jgi:hypothetical protein